MSSPQPPVPGPPRPQPGGSPEERLAEARQRLEQLEADPGASPAQVADALEEVRDLLRRGLSESGTG